MGWDWEHAGHRNRNACDCEAKSPNRVQIRFLDHMLLTTSYRQSAQIVTPNLIQILLAAADDKMEFELLKYHRLEKPLKGRFLTIDQFGTTRHFEEPDPILPFYHRHANRTLIGYIFRTG